MQEPMPAAQAEETETRDELIERLLAKSDLDYKCCGSHCSATRDDAG